jgi:EAL domain-containing protein (putative c-di-GMP-specific phosphodiesterase class I)
MLSLILDAISFRAISSPAQDLPFRNRAGCSAGVLVRRAPGQGPDESRKADRVGLEVVFERTLDSLSLAFQPTVSATDHTVIAHEALMRSATPALPGPLDVLGAAERLGRFSTSGDSYVAGREDSLEASRGADSCF